MENKEVAESVWSSLASQIPSKTAYKDFTSAQVREELNWLLNKYNARWGAEGKLPAGPKISCSIPDFVRLLGENKVLTNADYSHIRIFPPRFVCGYCTKVFASSRSCEQHITAVHTEKSANNKVPEPSHYWYCATCERDYDGRILSETNHASTRSHQSALRRINSTCNDCGALCGSAKGLAAHRLKQHPPAVPAKQQQQAAPKRSAYDKSYCHICEVYCGTVSGLQKHTTKRHTGTSNLASEPQQRQKTSNSGNNHHSSSSTGQDRKNSTPSASSNAPSEALACTLCGLAFTSAQAKLAHENSLGHRMNVKQAAGERSQPDVSVEIELANTRKSADIVFDVRKCPYTTARILISNRGAGIASVQNVFAVPAMDSVNVAALDETPTQLGPGMFLSVPVRIRTDLIGTLPFRVVVRLGTGDKLIPVTISVIDDIVLSLAPARPYARKAVPIDLLSDNPEIMDGERPTELPAVSLLSRILPSLIREAPAEFVNVLVHPEHHLRLFAERLVQLPVAQATRELSKFSDLELLKYLLYVEQRQLEVNIKYYNIEGARMEQRGAFLRLPVSGLAEKRPSVLIGDSVIARSSSSPGRSAWKGYVHVAELDAVLLKFHPNFHQNFIQGAAYNIQFEMNNFPMRRCLTALKLLQSDLSTSYFLNPAPMFGVQSTYHHLQMLSDTDKLSGSPLNLRQKQAVSFMAFGPILNAPYILFGPAGTGKTTTIVEAILQVQRYVEEAKILVITPSNSSADHVVQKLSGFLGKTQMFRLNALHRKSDTVPEAVQKYCVEKATDWFGLPGMKTLRSYSVIASTCISAGMLYAVSIGAHFTHVFVDEASQATEPETLIGLAGITTKDCRFVLGGDPKQLGPIINNIAARRVGYDHSFMERLFINGTYLKSPTYQEFGGYNPFYITKLTDNYRSHPLLLQVPSALFYEGELVASADKARSNAFVGWDQLPNRSVPLMFHSVTYKDERENNSPSYFNAGECSVVVDYVKKILAYKGWPVRSKDIGIISPYHKQVQKLREALTNERLYDRKAGADQIKIASVEEFQGQERLVIIVSTVRSSPDLVLSHDAKFNLGFLRNPKRLNVAITRPQALLIVVGSPSVLYHDPNWKSLIDFCLNQNAYRGNPPPPADPTLYFNEINLTDAASLDGVSDRLTGRDD